MSITMQHDFRLSFEQNAINNCERFMSANEPLRDDLLSQVKTVIRQNRVMITQYQDEIKEARANLENVLHTTYARKVREWDSKRQTHYEREIMPREKQIKVLQEQNEKLQKCLDFHQKEVRRRKKAELEKQVQEYPKRIKDLSQTATGADKALIKAVYALAKVLGGKSLFQALEPFASIPQQVKKLENERLLLEDRGVTCDEIPDALHKAAKELDKLCQIAEKIVGQKHPARMQCHTTIAKTLELSRIKEQKAEMEARRREGLL